MISNRMKNKYTLKRKRHILRKKEHVGEKYLADFSGNRKFLSVISVLVLVTAIRQTSAAQDLGGFHSAMFAEDRAFQASSTINCFLTPFNRRILLMKASMMMMVTTGKSSRFSFILSISKTMNRLPSRSMFSVELSRKS